VNQDRVVHVKKVFDYSRLKHWDVAILKASALIAWVRAKEELRVPGVHPFAQALEAIVIRSLKNQASGHLHRGSDKNIWDVYNGEALTNKAGDPSTLENMISINEHGRVVFDCDLFMSAPKSSNPELAELRAPLLAVAVDKAPPTLARVNEMHTEYFHGSVDDPSVVMSHLFRGGDTVPAFDSFNVDVELNRGVMQFDIDTVAIGPVVEQANFLLKEAVKGFSKEDRLCSDDKTSTQFRRVGTAIHGLTINKPYALNPVADGASGDLKWEFAPSIRGGVESVGHQTYVPPDKFYLADQIASRKFEDVDRTSSFTEDPALVKEQIALAAQETGFSMPRNHPDLVMFAVATGSGVKLGAAEELAKDKDRLYLPANRLKIYGKNGAKVVQGEVKFFKRVAGETEVLPTAFDKKRKEWYFTLPTAQAARTHKLVGAESRPTATVLSVVKPEEFEARELQRDFRTGAEGTYSGIVKVKVGHEDTWHEGHGVLVQALGPYAAGGCDCILLTALHLFPADYKLGGPSTLFIAPNALDLEENEALMARGRALPERLTWSSLDAVTVGISNRIIYPHGQQ